MSLTLAPYVGNGTRRNPFRTALEGASIDLRPDCSKRDGYALVNTQERVRRLKLGEGFKDTFGYRIRNRVHDLLGVDVSRVRRFDVLAAKLLLEPNGWLPLLPTHERFEIWLGGLVWEFPLIRGGASDNFNRADENPLTAPWTAVMGSAARLVSNAVRPDADVMIGYTGSVSSINQYSECVAPNATTQEAGPACRASSTGGGEGYIIILAGTHAFYKIVGGSYSSIIATGTSEVNGATSRLEVEGSTLRYYQNGVRSPASPQTDTSITAVGLAGMRLQASETLDTWSGGNLAVVTYGGHRLRGKGMASDPTSSTDVL